MYVLSDSSKKSDCQRPYMAALFTETDHGNSFRDCKMPLALCFFTMQYAFKGKYKQLYKTDIGKIQNLDDVVESSLSVHVLH